MKDSNKQTNAKAMSFWDYFTDFYQECGEIIAEAGGDGSDYRIEVTRPYGGITFRLVKLKGEEKA